MSGGPRISYLVPVYNEELVLPGTAAAIVDRLGAHPGSELIMVENGSTDSSPKLVDELAEQLSSADVSVVAAHSEKGYGNAMRHGIDLARGDLLVITAADLPFGFSDLDEALRITPRPSLLIGSKAHPGSRVAASPKRRLMSATFRLLRLALIRLRVGDSQGTILIDRELARRVRPHLEAGGFFFSTELIAVAEALGARAVEVPVDYGSPRPGSTVRPLHDGARMVRELIRLRRRLPAIQGATSG